MEEHEVAFEKIKELVASRECLTVVDHQNPGNKKIFVTTDASDLGTGAVLSFGKTWETARPVAFDSKHYNDAEKNYPTHDKEMLAIVRALRKFRTDLLGAEFTVYTDHRTLEYFNSQKELSKRQLRWQEFLCDYNYKIVYVKGEDNTVADALSRLPVEERANVEVVDICGVRRVAHALSAATAACPGVPIAATLEVTTDKELLRKIKEGYLVDGWCQRLMKDGMTMKGVRKTDGLLYLADRLIIPRAADVREELFQAAHDALGHFGSTKSYAALRDSFYWPNMRTDLEKGYIPSCVDCQRNKSATTASAGPLHPLPIPDGHCESVAMDFVGPLPEDEGYNYLLTITDRLGSDIRLVPCKQDLTAEQLAVLFFDHWYCENGLPLDIISDRDKLFVSRFWRALHKLTGVKLKMSTAFHPQTDGASERTNKTVVEAIRFHVDRDQKGWVKALPRVRFAIMNTKNASTGFAPFQLRFGRSPRVLPPQLGRAAANSEVVSEVDLAMRLIEGIEADVMEAKDNLVNAKLAQAAQANKHRRDEVVYHVGDKVYLSTANRRKEYMHAGDGRVSKFMPRFDGPYKVVKSHPETSTYTLDLPNSAVHPTFHGSLLKRAHDNDDERYASRKQAELPPVLVDGAEEYFVDRILDEKKVGRGYRFLVRWVGWGPEEDRWMSRAELEDCEALDTWLRAKGRL